MSKEHPAVSLVPPGMRKAVPIDKEIAPLIQAMWSLGISTNASCQDHDGMVQIVMSVEDVRLFLTVVARHADKKVARAAARAGLGPEYWDLHLWSQAWERGKHTSIGLATAVYFPREHLAEVTKALATLAK